jgi:hypothetical protein
MRLRFAVLAAAMSTLAFAAAPGIAGAAPRHNHGLTIAVTPNPIIAGDHVTIYGQLNGPGSGDQTIRLFHRVNPHGFFTPVGTTTTNSAGFYEFTRAEGVVLSNRSWFARGPSNSHSRTVHERVAALVNLATSTTSGITNHPLTFTGHLTPSHAGQRVLLQEQKGSTDDWRTIKAGRIRLDSSFAISARFRVPNAYTVRALFPGDARNTRAASDPLAVTIQQAQVEDFTINSSDPIIKNGSSTAISGVLEQAGTGTPQPMIGVTLFVRGPDQAHFRALQTGVTGSDGSYSFSRQPAENQLYQVRETFAPHRHTAVLFDGVQDVLAMAASSPSSTVGGRVTFMGSVTPSKAGHVVYLQRLGEDNDWHTVEVGFVRSNSTFQLGWTFGTTGEKTFRARITGDEENVGGASAPVSIAVGPSSVASLPPAS